MTQRSFATQILARAKTPAAIAEMNGWREPDLFAAAESSLLSLVESVFGGTWQNGVIDSLRLADGSPHFSGMLDGEQTAVYILCISSAESAASLTTTQYEWIDAHKEVTAWVIPCVVQHLKSDYSRCVAERAYPVFSGGQWADAPEIRQFLPAAQRPVHWLGGSGILKQHNLVRETVNNGSPIFPYVEGLAHNRHLPQGMQVLSSGGVESPLLLALAEKSASGSVRVRWADFYSAANPVNELELLQVHTDGIEVLDARGRQYHATCAEAAMFGRFLKTGMHLKCAVSIVAETVAFTPGAPSCFTSIPQKRASLTAAVKTVEPALFCGMTGYCLSVQVNEHIPGQLFNVYVFAPLLGGRVPIAGDTVAVSGPLHVAIDALVESEHCWADSPETAQALAADERATDAERMRCAVAPYGTLLAEVAAAFAHAGYQFAEPFEPLYRFGRPEFVLQNAEGKRLMVLVDCIVDGANEFWGYRRRFYPDHYPAHVTKTPQGSGPADLCFLTLKLTTQSPAHYHLEAEQHGTVVPLSLPEWVTLATPPKSELTEQMAAQLLAECMQTQRFDALLPYLSENLSYRSETAALEFGSKSDFLRHLRSRFDMWTKNNDWPELSFTVGTISQNGLERYGMMAHQNGDFISATTFTLEGAFITEMESLSAEQLGDMS